MTGEHISLGVQATAVRLAAQAHRDALERIWERVRTGKYPADDFERRKARLRQLEAAAETMELIAARQAERAKSAATSQSHHTAHHEEQKCQSDGTARMLGA